jgi:hypothetical protein
MNKAKQVREVLGLTPTEAGKLLFGYESKKSYDQWTQWEKSKTLSKPTEQYFNLILFLAIARDLKTPGASQALDKYLVVLRNGHEGT